jgi:hypothetical protein
VTRDEVFGSTGRGPGRLGDEDTRMPKPDPKLVGSSRVAFVLESLPGRAVLTGPGPGERCPVVVGPVRVGVQFWRREGPFPWLAVRWAASQFRVNQGTLALVAARGRVLAAPVRVTRRRPEPGRPRRPSGVGSSLVTLRVCLSPSLPPPQKTTEQ